MHDNNCCEGRLLVSVVIPSHNGLRLLQRCLQSLSQQSYERIEVIMVDNGSTDGSAEYVAQTFPEAKIKRNQTNLGFAKAVNIGIAQSSGEYLFILNNDTELRSDCIEQLVAAMRYFIAKDDGVIGIAPKIVFDRLGRTFLDAVGTGMNPDGAAFNIGVGQPDLGQLDSPRRVFGVCFAAALIRKQAFDAIGHLDESFYAYYEDVDWCYRANLFGYKFYSAPNAVVYHKHSVSATKLLSYERKYILIHRNYIRTMIKNFYRGNLIKAAKKIARHILEVYHSALGRSPRMLSAHLRIVFESILAAPLLLFHNVAINRRRVVTDPSIWALSSAPIVQISGVSFDPQTYSPILTVDILIEIFRSLVENDPTQSFDKYVSFLFLGLMRERLRLPKLEAPPGDAHGVYTVGNVLARRANGTIRILTRDGSLIVEPFIYRFLLGSHGRSLSEILRHTSVIQSFESHGPFNPPLAAAFKILLDLLARAHI
jgi:GT2 family glycosyltransferase